MIENAMEIKSLVKEPGNFNVLEGISFSINCGEIFSFLKTNKWIKQLW